MDGFRFIFRQEVRIKVSSEVGTVIGIAAYPDSPNQYYVLYKAGDGRAVKNWWNEDEICNM
jgi:hypothetical protein